MEGADDRAAGLFGIHVVGYVDGVEDVFDFFGFFGFDGGSTFGFVVLFGLAGRDVSVGFVFVIGLFQIGFFFLVGFDFAAFGLRFDEIVAVFGDGFF